MKRGKSDDVMTIPLTRDSFDRKGERKKTAFDEQLNSVEKVSFDFFEGNRETYFAYGFGRVAYSVRVYTLKQLA